MLLASHWLCCDTGSATAAEMNKMNLHGGKDLTSLLSAGTRAAKQSGSKHSGSSSYPSDDDLAGPVVTGRHCAKSGYCAHCIVLK